MSQDNPTNTPTNGIYTAKPGETIVEVSGAGGSESLRNLSSQLKPTDTELVFDELKVCKYLLGRMETEVTALRTINKSREEYLETIEKDVYAENEKLRAENAELKSALKLKAENGCCIVEHGWRMTAEHKLSAATTQMEKMAEALKLHPRYDDEICERMSWGHVKDVLASYEQWKKESV